MPSRSPEVTSKSRPLFSYGGIGVVEQRGRFAVDGYQSAGLGNSIEIGEIRVGAIARIRASIRSTSSMASCDHCSAVARSDA